MPADSPQSARSESFGPQGQHWDAGLYDDKHSFVWKKVSDLLDLLAARPGERILDLGCGTGHLTAQIAAAGAQVVGLDMAPAMIEQARQAYPDIRFDWGDARSFTYQDPFDAIFSNAVLHWIKEPQQVIACVKRALRPGGRFIAEFGGKGNIATIVVALEHASLSILAEPFASPWYFPSIAEYSTLLEQHGLEVTFATLFDRPTQLEGDEGLHNWLGMFANALLARVPAAKRESFLREVETRARPALYRDGYWYADYRRLRVVALRKT